jgi:hypothetical protein
MRILDAIAGPPDSNRIILRNLYKIKTYYVTERPTTPPHLTVLDDPLNDSPGIRYAGKNGSRSTEVIPLWNAKRRDRGVRQTL